MSSPQRQPAVRRDRPTEELDAARRLFFERGYRGTTIQQIAEHAGYSKRTVYLDYQNKDELFMTVCAEGGELLLALLQEVPADDLDVEACVDAFLDVYVRFSQEHRAYFRIIFNEATPEVIGNCSDPLRERVAQVERSCLGVLVRWTERAVAEGLIQSVDPWETAGMLTGAVTGIILLSMAGSQTVFSDETRYSLARKAVATFWRGLAATGSTEHDGGAL